MLLHEGAEGLFWGRGGGVRKRGYRGGGDEVDINLSPAAGLFPPPVDHTEDWNAWRIAAMVRQRQNTHCAGGSWMV